MALNWLKKLLGIKAEEANVEQAETQTPEETTTPEASEEPSSSNDMEINQEENKDQPMQ
jgi:hypothetical protein